MLKQYLVLLSFYLLFFTGQAQEVWMNPNNGQWDDRILYQVDLAGGKMYLEEDGFVFHFYEAPRSHQHEEGDEHHNNEASDKVKNHVVRSKFVNSTWNGERKELGVSPFYNNYFFGSNRLNWQSEVYSYSKVVYKNFYSGIDLIVDGSEDQLKYSFEVFPGEDVTQISNEIDGADALELDGEGNLTIHTSLGTITESQPIAWIIDGEYKREVKIEYQVSGNKVSYSFPDGYDDTKKLVIDPYLVFSTFSGATTDNWGMTATPGPNGETYAGGISFGTGYPTTLGAFDVTHNGGTTNGGLPGFDIAISKFDDVGQQLLYSTYIGGSANELPQSMISGTNGELFVLGITASPNFPIASNAYQSTFAGGPATSAHSLLFNGSDIYVLKLNAAGTSLDASTFIGGSDIDGFNASTLFYNYGDSFRGEIGIDGQENVYIASHTQSADYPVTNGSTLSGEQDVVVTKLNNSLSGIEWSSYYGGSLLETGYSIAISSLGEVFVAGGTNSIDFSLNGNDPNYDGGIDGYVMKLDPNDGTMLAGSYMGDMEYDQTYFVRTDIDNAVYVYGQTETSWAITPGCYGVANSGQFLRKYSNDLTTIEWTTVFGAGSGHPEISPTAFLISDCYDIFVAGWGGAINSSGPAQFSSSDNFPITADAYQSGTNGSNFYLGILSAEAASLLYGTYMGGQTSSSNHVDGGTSRFDKSGAVYHAVCAACGGNDNGFTSTPGVWSTTNNSPNCNLAAFKFQLGLPYSLSANTTVCNGDPIQLSATGGISYSWSPASSLDDPNSPNPIATPTETTVYYVEMDFNEGCAIVDSIVIEVIQVPDLTLQTQSELCEGDTITISADGGLTYSWAPNQNISSTNNPIVEVWPIESQYYYCTITNECFSAMDSIFIDVHDLPNVTTTSDTMICEGGSADIAVSGANQYEWIPHPDLTVIGTNQASVTPEIPTYFFVTGVDVNGCENIDSVYVDFYEIPVLLISNDTIICFEESIQLTVSGADEYEWSPASSLNDPSASSPIATPLTPTLYYVDATYGIECALSDSVFVDLRYLPTPALPDSLSACYGVEHIILASGADSYQWTPGTYLNTTEGAEVITAPLSDITYDVSFTNVCGTVIEDVVVTAIIPNVEAFNDTIICPEESAIATARGGVSYTWSPTSSLHYETYDTVVVSPTIPTYYVVTGADEFGCLDSDSVFVDLFPHPFIQTSPDQYLYYGDEVELLATSSTSGPYVWSPSDFLSCTNCTNPIAAPPSTFTYTVSYTDVNGCSASDDVTIYIETLLYVPNTFTPDEDEFNQSFLAMGGNIESFKMLIFNRWGEVIFESNDMEVGWDGTYKGQKCQDGTYVWKIILSDLDGKKKEHVGHVNLIR